MTITRREENRLLSQAEREAVAPTHHPEILDLPDNGLQDATRRLRDMRDRARDIGRQQRREMRGKAAARGASPAADNTGTARKQQVLSQALKRLNREATRRQKAAKAPQDLAESARRALAQKRAAAKRHHPSAGWTAGEGMRSTPSDERTVTVDPREIGRVSQFVRDAQVRRDSK